jgi:tRNA threonylcarbamoyladenosine modification (KEOPS) complex Cgi121 subunit
MQKAITEYGKIVEITGFPNIEIDDAEAWIKTAQADSRHNVAVQFFNADIIATWEHLYFAALNALTAFATNRNLSRNVAMETMLYASAQRQIRRAIEFIGVKRGVANVGVVVIGDSPSQVQKATSEVKKRFGKEPDDSVLALSETKIKHIREVFGISDDEAKAVVKNDNFNEALVNLVVERVALLTTQL